MLQVRGEWTADQHVESHRQVAASVVFRLTSGAQKRFRRWTLRKLRTETTVEIK